jgi:4-diphosphocytidyl-2-C-methyl-D-erythritol kinase
VASSPRHTAAVTVRACAKINLTLHVTHRQPDGYHGLRTIFQSIAMHDTLTFSSARGPFRIECDDPGCPTGEANLVWRAAAKVWRAAGRRGVPRDVTVRIAKRIPLQSGLGGGSSDAAAAVRGLSCLWRAALPLAVERAVAASIGADVPFFFEGGTALGLDRGDLLFPLIDHPPGWVTLVTPPFGVITSEAYGWFDEDDGVGQSVPGILKRAVRGLGGERVSQGARYGNLPSCEYRNDLEGPVAARHPDIARIVRALRRAGAAHAAMSGSGSAVFGVFASKIAAARAARSLATAGRRAAVTRMVGRAEYAALSAPTSAPK